MSIKTQGIITVFTLSIISLPFAVHAQDSGCDPASYCHDCTVLEQALPNYCQHLKTYKAFIHNFKPPDAKIIPDMSYDLNAGVSGDDEDSGQSTPQASGGAQGDDDAARAAAKAQAEAEGALHSIEHDLTKFKTMGP